MDKENIAQNKFRIKFIIAELSLLLIFSTLTFSTNYYIKKEVAKQISRIVGRIAKRGDYREIIYTLGSAQLKNFKSIKYLDQKGEELFSIPVERKYFKNSKFEIFQHKISENIYYENKMKKNKVGTLLFSFDYIIPILFGIILWIISFIMTIPLIRKYFHISLNKIKIDSENKILIEKERISKQIFHDLNSPLTSLEHALVSIHPILPESKRISLKEIMTRIHDIINTISLPNRTHDPNKLLKPELISLMVKKIISEKRIELNSNDNIKINLKDSLPYGIHSIINHALFSRCLSNIINNSVEAKKPLQKINIDIELKMIQSGSIKIAIIDDGIGIPKNKMDKVFNYGETFNKKRGSGLGLYQAKEYIHKMNGTLSIESKEGKGTKVSLSFKISPPPTWFKKTLIFKSHHICIIDDDESIHETWREILSQKRLNIISIKSSKQFHSWAKENDLDKFDFLFDLELLGSNENGLDLISTYHLQKRSTLVTSYYDDKDIQRKASLNNITILPKELVTKIKIELFYEDEIVLIDDDILIHKMWNSMAKKRGKMVHSFMTIKDFISKSNSFKKEINIYVDSHLKQSIKGEIEAKKIYDRGFKNIHLATGSSFQELPLWIKSQQGKDCPF